MEVLIAVAAGAVGDEQRILPVGGLAADCGGRSDLDIVTILDGVDVVLVEATGRCFFFFFLPEEAENPLSFVLVRVGIALLRGLPVPP